MRLIGLVLALSLALAPLAAEAQPPRKVAKIGVLTPSANVEPASDAFDQALQELGDESLATAFRASLIGSPHRW